MDFAMSLCYNVEQYHWKREGSLNRKFNHGKLFCKIIQKIDDMGMFLKRANFIAGNINL